MEQTGLDEILSGEPAVEQVEQPEIVEQAERPRDDHGRFLPKDTGEQAPAPAAEPPQVVEPPQAAPPAAEQPRMVPLDALEDERRKRQELERRFQELETRIQPKPQAAPVEIPDPVLHPEAYSAYQDDQRYNDRLHFSERLARVEHGAETFEKAREWGFNKCNDDPHFNAKIRQSQDPYSVVMSEYQREQAASALAGVGDLDAYKAKLRAEIEDEIRASLPSTLTAPPTTAGTRSVGARSGPEWSGPTELNSILPGR